MFKQGQQADVAVTFDSFEQSHVAVARVQLHVIIEHIGNCSATQQQVDQLLVRKHSYYCVVFLLPPVKLRQRGAYCQHVCLQTTKTKWRNVPLTANGAESERPRGSLLFHCSVQKYCLGFSDTWRRIFQATLQRHLMSHHHCRFTAQKHNNTVTSALKAA